MRRHVEVPLQRLSPVRPSTRISRKPGPLVDVRVAFFRSLPAYLPANSKSADGAAETPQDPFTRLYKLGPAGILRSCWPRTSDGTYSVNLLRSAPFFGLLDMVGGLVKIWSGNGSDLYGSSTGALHTYIRRSGSRPPLTLLSTLFFFFESLELDMWIGSVHSRVICSVVFHSSTYGVSYMYTHT